ncbi:hypothetical protein DCAR_0101917 [Daucus carota subsp. sativus]|uniref:Uncharacterized protein n=1 Tax=Daucus carota subsp. sativus TaxID=79200 RepID=A0A162B2P3_DAUCS|nr:hypothetical protein DCAR_0101917 [Daucus carota subsp. sativus]
MGVTLSDIYLDNPPTRKIIFKISSGLYRSLLVSAFKVQDVEYGKKLKEMAVPKMEHRMTEANGTEEGDMKEI